MVTMCAAGCCDSHMGRVEEALCMHERSMRIKEKVHGQCHPSLATSLNNMAFLLASQVREHKFAVETIRRLHAWRKKSAHVFLFVRTTFSHH